MISGAVTMVVATALGTWAVTRAHHKHGAVVLAILSLLLLAVGGGFAPPVVGLIVALGATRLVVPGHQPGKVGRSLARVWPYALAAGVVGYLGLVLGTLLAYTLWGPPNPATVYGLIVLAFGGLITSLVSARAHDRVRAAA